MKSSSHRASWRTSYMSFGILVRTRLAACINHVCLWIHGFYFEVKGKLNGTQLSEQLGYLSKHWPGIEVVHLPFWISSFKLQGIHENKYLGKPHQSKMLSELRSERASKWAKIFVRKNLIVEQVPLNTLAWNKRRTWRTSHCLADTLCNAWPKLLSQALEKQVIKPGE